MYSISTGDHTPCSLSFFDEATNPFALVEEARAKVPKAKICLFEAHCEACERIRKGNEQIVKRFGVKTVVDKEFLVTDLFPGRPCTASGFPFTT